MTAFSAKAPARANLIGEHTDYAPNGGHVLPTPLPFHTTVTMESASGPTGHVTLSSETFAEQPCERVLTDERRGHWSDYVVGCLRVAAAKVELPALQVKVKSDRLRHIQFRRAVRRRRTRGEGADRIQLERRGYRVDRL